MTVEDLQLFNPKASVQNEIPTVNINFLNEEKTMGYAPAEPLKQPFNTFAMDQIDHILCRVGSTGDGLWARCSPVERVVHKFHMLDLWSRIHTVFKELQEVGTSPALCPCLLDTRHNGIRASIELMAEQYKTGPPILPFLGLATPKLTDSTSWGVWKQRLFHHYEQSNLIDAAIYLKCATRKFEGHPLLRASQLPKADGISGRGTSHVLILRPRKLIQSFSGAAFEFNNFRYYATVPTHKEFRAAAKGFALKAMALAFVCSAMYSAYLCACRWGPMSIADESFCGFCLGAMLFWLGSIASMYAHVKHSQLL
jgi:hypothetical protein